ncbi:3-oxoacyl-ACP synthase III family protein [Streptantibioticus cattleyicolor]|uniref:Beta-ketoacyl-acyl-carrier-protein synthase III n=1 Tax=Streptantibioticus cattleyicolor (strain ATCC 35852 / DSM 46488 / JCM 4925 / NBRC 14057 / NRRL 8057) TaxID=1003195 RepID=F8JKR2_STREN|nr:3-oxoacyl-ACP synthase III family protein [Streptantibioticus cattleyicolor]AEW98444.1 Beta-ketoacyl-acyl-carrier-protein synthase III [Streptantibioticus cattleyicolor NRRL 8057 = DSM 46488]CCB72500.1 ChlM [Streptantibioticus cattleyicolor NRRL 8057 = DSM 46488]
MPSPVIRIASVGTALPGDPVDNAALIRGFRLPAVWEQWIDVFVGTRSRHFCVDLETGSVRQSLADLGTAAGRKALDAAGVDGGDIDLVVMASATPDTLMPATVNIVADRLGIDGVPTYQLQSGCTGALQALDVACQMLTTGRHRTALVIGGDTCAKHLDLAMDLAGMSPNMQVNIMLFGDGSGAAVLTTEPRPQAPVLRRVFTRLQGRGREPGQTVRWYGTADRGDPGEPVSEDFKAIEASAPGMAAEALQDLLDDLDWKKEELDYILPPQLSGKMTRRVLDHLAVPGAEEISRVEEIGNTVNAIPFFQLEQILPDMVPGERAIGISVEASKWIKAGYAVELPVGGAEER